MTFAELKEHRQYQLPQTWTNQQYLKLICDACPWIKVYSRTDYAIDIESSQPQLASNEAIQRWILTQREFDAVEISRIVFQLKT